MKYTTKLGSHIRNYDSEKNNGQTNDPNIVSTCVFDDEFWTEVYEDLLKRNSNGQTSSPSGRIDKKSLSTRAAYLKSLLSSENVSADMPDNLSKDEEDRYNSETPSETLHETSRPTSLMSADSKIGFTTTSAIFNKFQAALMSDFSGGKDITKGYELLRYFDLVERGHLVSNNGKYKHLSTLGGKIHLKGAENWGNVMCYLDALLFAMFSKIENFEPLLYSYLGVNKEQEDIKISRLRAILRLYVSLLRSGELITQDITKILCESLKENGIEEAMSRKQEDSSQLFLDLADLLKLPLLTLKIDIAHGGKEVKEDDHKFTQERMLYVSIPGEEDNFLVAEDKEDVENRVMLKVNAFSDSDNKGIFKVLPKKEVQNLNPIDELIDVEHKKGLVNQEIGFHPAYDEPIDPKSVIDIEGGKEDSKLEQGNRKNALLFNASANVHDENSSHNDDSCDEEDEFVLLEECLEHYFNNSIEVKRQLERRRATITDIQANADLGRSNTCTENDHSKKEDSAFPEETLTEVREISTNDDSLNYDGLFYDADDSIATSKDNRRGIVTYFDSNGILDAKLGTDNNTDIGSCILRTSSIKKDPIKVSVRSRADSNVSIFSDSKNREVSLPAWMFLKLLPFYTDLEPRSKTEQGFAAKRPILPICLKRYSYNKQHSTKNNKKVIIPSFINLPRFIADEETNGPKDGTEEAEKENIDEESERNSTQPEYSGFRLILESAVCHRGSNVNSGHYVALVRDESFDVNTTEKEEDEKTWILFDDLNTSQRVEPTTFKKAFSAETPYILFYRMAPYEDINSTDAGNDDGSHLKKDNHVDLSSVNTRLTCKRTNNENSLVSTEPATPNHGGKLEDPDTSSINHGSNEAHNTGRKSHDLKSKMILHSSTYPYPNSREYIDIKDRFYWKLKTPHGYEEESPLDKIREHPRLAKENMEVVKTRYGKRYSLFSSSKRHSAVSLADNGSDSACVSDTDSSTAPIVDGKLSETAVDRVKTPRMSLDGSFSSLKSTTTFSHTKSVGVGSDAQHHLHTVMSRRSRKKKLKKEKYKREKCVIQ